MSLTQNSHSHLKAHHGDYAEFAELMVATSEGRFDPVFWGFLQKFSGTPRAILDFGTGPGVLLGGLKKKYPHATVTGIEAQPEMIRRLTESGYQNSSQLVEHDLAIAPYPLDSQSFDLSVASMVLHEMPVPTILIDEAYRLLKEGGIWIVYDWVRQPLKNYFDNTRPNSLDQFTHFSEHCRYTPEDLCWMFERSGFKVLESVTRHDGRHALIALQK